MTTTEESKPPSLSTLARGNNMITIDVGAEHAKYSVYAELIAYYSGYFKGTLNGPWKEAEDRVIELPDIEPRVFDIFVDWLYTQRLPQKTRDWIVPNPELEAGSTGHGQQAERLMMKTYVFADRFIVPQFRVTIFNYYASFCNSGGNPPYYDAIIYAFDNLPPTSAMLTLLVKIHCAYWNENSDTTDNGELELRQDLPQDFFLRGMVQFSKMRDKSKAKGIACCDCHKEPATTEREGCDNCMPLPEVKEEVPAEGDDQADATAADGNDQANQANAASADDDQANNDPVDQVNVIPATNNDQANPIAGQAVQVGEGTQTDQSSNQANEVAGPANQAHDQTAEADTVGQNAQNDERLDTTTENVDSERRMTDSSEVAIESAEVIVLEARASSNSHSNGVATDTGELETSGVAAALESEADVSSSAQIGGFAEATASTSITRSAVDTETSAVAIVSPVDQTTQAAVNTQSVAIEA